MMMAQRPVRSAGRAFLLSSNRDGGMSQGSHRSCWIRFVVLLCLLVSATPLWAQHDQQHQASVQQTLSPDHQHHGAVGHQAGWEGSVAGIAYSEFNHHLNGILVLLIGLSEVRQALALPFWAWTRFLLPGALLTVGSFLLVWSDHDAWPIGSLSFMQTFFGSDSEIFQHKSYGLLSVTVGVIELLRRFGQLGHAGWATPLPAFAIIGGLMLFGHTHGVHPSADKIAIDHAIMGTMAVTAGSFKLLSDWFRSPSHARLSKWELLWAGLLTLIGIQLLIYSE
jgi:putative copper resistance protein D